MQENVADHILDVQRREDPTKRTTVENALLQINLSALKRGTRLTTVLLARTLIGIFVRGDTLRSFETCRRHGLPTQFDRFDSV